jgi:hypothetical protein
MKRVVLADLDQAIIDKNIPLKIQITMSGETNGVYVFERNYDSFVVKENNNGQSNAAFDWTVIAKVLSEEEVIPSVDLVPEAVNTSTENQVSTEPVIINETQEASSTMPIDMPAEPATVPVTSEPDPIVETAVNSSTNP